MRLFELLELCFVFLEFFLSFFKFDSINTSAIYYTNVWLEVGVACGSV